jgi:hypothetical protein
VGAKVCLTVAPLALLAEGTTAIAVRRALDRQTVQLLRVPVAPAVAGPRWYGRRVLFANG